MLNHKSQKINQLVVHQKVMTIAIKNANKPQKLYNPCISRKFENGLSREQGRSQDFVIGGAKRKFGGGGQVLKI